MPRRTYDPETEDYYQQAHDERISPNRNIEPHMPDADWGSVLINPELKKAPVGDPTLWGNSITTLIDADPILGNTPRIITSEQILLTQAQDAYSRSWSLIGTLAVKGIGWRFLNGEPPQSNDPPTDGMNVFLSVLQGVGKVTIEHQVCLAANGFPTNIGLAWNQSAMNGGPYAPIYSPLPNTADSYMVLSFAMVGALIGNSIGVRALYSRGSDALSGPIPSAIMTCMITPYQPGTGI